MPRKKRTSGLGYQAELARKRAERTIRAAQKELGKVKYRGQLQQEAQQDIADLKRFIEQTKMKDATGKTKEGYTSQFKRDAVQRMERANINLREKMRGSFDYSERRFIRQQMALASYEASPIYSQTEVQVFMRATQKAWNQRDESGKLIYGRDRRLEAIADYFELDESQLADFMKKVIADNREIIDQVERARERAKTDGTETAREKDNGDEDKPSPEWFMTIPLYDKETAPVIEAQEVSNS